MYNLIHITTNIMTKIIKYNMSMPSSCCKGHVKGLRVQPTGCVGINYKI